MMLAASTPIAWMNAPDCGGRIGMMACPGGGFHPGVAEARLRHDLDTLHAAGARALVTLLPEDEMVLACVATLGEEVEARGMLWLHLPIGDMQAPGEAFEIRWTEAGPRLRALLGEGGGVVFHCMAGLGRTGTVAARLAVDMGLTPPEAIRQVRAARPGAIQSDQQMRYVLELAGR